MIGLTVWVRIVSCGLAAAQRMGDIGMFRFVRSVFAGDSSCSNQSVRRRALVL
jgi:hypothetical protein